MMQQYWNFLNWVSVKLLKFPPYLNLHDNYVLKIISLVVLKRRNKRGEWITPRNMPGQLGFPGPLKGGFDRVRWIHFRQYVCTPAFHWGRWMLLVLVSLVHILSDSMTRGIGKVRGPAVSGSQARSFVVTMLPQSPSSPPAHPVLLSSP